ncbi:hypothetical protein NE237_022047 [Protea cynaroides]|uniref:Uncharacterized protein n=1 Tax=Protea cynaroides TaxID=273540 RepID=A0A9Q0H936_9MAGN|nr:hypothetical protein NE237_022047 [Protea cynaroides]
MADLRSDLEPERSSVGMRVDAGRGDAMAVVQGSGGSSKTGCENVGFSEDLLAGGFVFSVPLPGVKDNEADELGLSPNGEDTRVEENDEAVPNRGKLVLAPDAKLEADLNGKD